ncbi:MAG TPA: ATP-binding protein [Acidimicrobiales bacterium]|jgi:anti-sigma regulatory factor (Ser/Thr protein kinase)|nr:ATP-binding protein [Acidimicrobiales bacterium]
MIASSLTRPVPLSPQPAAARHQVGQLLADAGWAGDPDTVILALHEALVNSQRHAGGVTGATVAIDGSAVVVEVRDRGRGFVVPESPAMPDPSAERGRGLFLIGQLADRAEVSRAGNDVCLHMRFER